MSNQELQFTMVGLGRMGANIVRRISGHIDTAHPVKISVFDVNPDTVKAVAAEGHTGLASLADLAGQNSDSNPQIVWVLSLIHI